MKTRLSFYLSQVVLVLFIVYGLLQFLSKIRKHQRPCVSPNRTESSLRASVNTCDYKYKMFQEEWLRFNLEYKTKLDEVEKKNIDPKDILILIVIEENTDMGQYVRAINTVDCYRRIHGYSFKVVNDKNYKDSCQQKNKFFRRHCIASKILISYKYLLFLDADSAVVNPKRRIEEFLVDRYHVILYDRFHNPEVAAGSYIVRNTTFGRQFLLGLANYETNLKEGTLHGTDNGAIHAYLVETQMGNTISGYNYCLDMWHQSQDYEDLFAFEYCVRGILGQHEDFGKIKITNKLSGWMRDGWLTNSLWSPKMDFILHGWKMHQYKNYTDCDLPIDITIKEPLRNFFPLLGSTELSLCKPGNTTWNYDVNLIASEEELRAEYKDMSKRVEENNMAVLARIQPKLRLILRGFV